MFTFIFHDHKFYSRIASVVGEITGEVSEEHVNDKVIGVKGDLVHNRGDHVQAIAIKRLGDWGVELWLEGVVHEGHVSDFSDWDT